MKVISNQSSIILLFVFSIGILFGCANEESVKDISDDNLLVEHWYELDYDKKYSIIRNVMDEEKIYMQDDKEHIDF